MRVKRMHCDRGRGSCIEPPHLYATCCHVATCAATTRAYCTATSLPQGAVYGGAAVACDEDRLSPGALAVHQRSGVATLAEYAYTHCTHSRITDAPSLRPGRRRWWRSHIAGRSTSSTCARAAAPSVSGGANGTERRCATYFPRVPTTSGVPRCAPLRLIVWFATAGCNCCRGGFCRPRREEEGPVDQGDRHGSYGWSWWCCCWWR